MPELNPNKKEQELDPKEMQLKYNLAKQVTKEVTTALLKHFARLSSRDETDQINPEGLAHKLISIIEGIGSPEINKIIVRNILSDQTGQGLPDVTKKALKKYFDLEY
jgi:hypothetical protein